ncbi:hypothetical protein AGMMS50249_7410 [candidate division SR1 bacterium]|nr:hypothetical protein AGMMS50249_7410 [candidate division SR1 bacterium]
MANCALYPQLTKAETETYNQTSLTKRLKDISLDTLADTPAKREFIIIRDKYINSRNKQNPFKDFNIKIKELVMKHSKMGNILSNADLCQILLQDMMVIRALNEFFPKSKHCDVLRYWIHYVFQFHDYWDLYRSYVKHLDCTASCFSVADKWKVLIRKNDIIYIRDINFLKNKQREIIVQEEKTIQDIKYDLMDQHRDRINLVSFK